jgi:hypothetical protein
MEEEVQAPATEPTKFGAKLAGLLYGPEGAGQYAVQPDMVNNAINAVEQQVATTKDPATDINGQFLKNYMWPIMKAKGQQANNMNQQKNAPLESLG